MPLQCLHAAIRPARLPPPDPNRAREVATGESAPIRTPGQREDRAGMGHLLHEGAQLRVPEPDGRITPPTCQQAAIGGKDQAGGAFPVPARPEQRSMLDIPQLEPAVQGPGSQRAFVRAEGERHHDVGMCLPDAK